MRTLAHILSSIALGVLVLLALVGVAAPSLLGVKYLVVTTGSMTPTIAPGDLIVTRPVQPEMIQPRDVITYFRDNPRSFTTHRVLAPVVGDDGKLAFQTKGDANDAPDAGVVPATSLIGRVELVVPRFGFLTRAARTPLGLMVIALIPIVVLGAQGVLEILDGRKKRQGQSAA